MILSGPPLLFEDKIVKVKIELCMGSSCFARGNSQVLSVLEDFLSSSGHSESAEIIGHLCMGNCSGGPVVRINNREYFSENADYITAVVGNILKAGV